MGKFINTILTDGFAIAGIVGNNFIRLFFLGCNYIKRKKKKQQQYLFHGIEDR